MVIYLWLTVGNCPQAVSYRGGYLICYFNLIVNLMNTIFIKLTTTLAHPRILFVYVFSCVLQPISKAFNYYFCSRTRHYFYSWQCPHMTSFAWFDSLLLRQLISRNLLSQHAPQKGMNPSTVCSVIPHCPFPLLLASISWIVFLAAAWWRNRPPSCR